MTTAAGRAHEAIVEDQFGPRARAYVDSSVHAAGADLDALEAIARAVRPARALDLGAGGGHVAYRLAPHAKSVIAVDLSAGMLAVVAETARERGIPNIETRAAPAEALPFADGEYDLLACRFSAHHWRRLDAGLAEARRVLAPGRPAVFIDAVSPGPAALDSHLQAIELLRDTSHVRDYAAAEWLAALARAGFRVRRTRAWRVRIDFASWIERMNTPDLNRDAVRALQRAASDEVRAHFAIEEGGAFHLDTLMLEAD